MSLGNTRGCRSPLPLNRIEPVRDGSWRYHFLEKNKWHLWLPPSHRLRVSFGFSAASVIKIAKSDFYANGFECDVYLMSDPRLPGADRAADGDHDSWFWCAHSDIHSSWFFLPSNRP